MNIIVTGAAGLYGVHLVDELVNMNNIESVIGVDDFSRNFLTDDPFIKSDAYDEKFRLIEGKFQDILSDQIDDWDIDAIVHLAASISIPESMENAAKQKMYIENNVLGTHQLMMNLNDSSKKPLMVYASSPEVYGNPIFTPMDESHPQRPCSVYAATKCAAEKLIHSYQQWYGYPAVIIRNFNTFGPNQNVWHDAAVISVFVWQALQDLPLTIHGDGEQTRDFQYVKDAIKAYSLIVNEGKEGCDGCDGVYNIGTGIQTTINDLAKTIIDITGSRSSILHTPGRPADLLALEADYSKITDRTGWIPQYSLKEGLEKSIPWYEDALRLKTLETT